MQDETFDVNAPEVQRNARELYEHLRAIRAAKDAKSGTLPRAIAGQEQAAKAYLEENSYVSAPDSSGFELMPCGNGSPFETLHQLDLGLALAAKEMTCELTTGYGEAIKADAKDESSQLHGKKSNTLGQLDAIIKQYRPARNSERHAFPTDAFPHTALPAPARSWAKSVPPSSCS